MIALLQTAVPIGIVGGYLMTALLVNYGVSVKIFKFLLISFFTVLSYT